MGKTRCKSLSVTALPFLAKINQNTFCTCKAAPEGEQPNDEDQEGDDARDPR